MSNRQYFISYAYIDTAGSGFGNQCIEYPDKIIDNDDIIKLTDIICRNNNLLPTDITVLTWKKLEYAD